MKIQTRLKGAAAPIALSLALVAQPVFAQDDASSGQNAAPSNASKDKDAASPKTSDDQKATTPTTTSAADDTTSVIVVTGSRIARRGIETSSPLEVVTSATLDARGFETVAQALNELPTFGVPGASPVGFNQSGFGAGQSFVNFLGLGSQRTLVLVNGKRFVSSNTGSIFGPTGSGGTQVDLNVIPTKLIDRVETVAAIGAPIYGSDAIAGTINIILKKDYEGISLDGQYGFATYGGNSDAPDFRIRGLVGKNFADGRGNITIAGEFDKSSGLYYTDRAISAPDSRFGRAPSGSGPEPIYADERIPSVDPNGVVSVGGEIFGLAFPLSPQQSTVIFGDPTANFGVTNSQGQQLRFSPTGQLIPIDFGGTVGATNGFSVFTSGGNGYSLRSVENLLTDLKRYSVNANLSYDLTDNVRFFGSAWFSVSQGRNLADQPVYNTALFGAAGSRDGNFIIPLTNPFLSNAARVQIQNSIANNPWSDQNLGLVQNQDYFYLGRANVDLTSGVSTGKSRVMRFVGGLDGTLHVLKDKDWHFEAYFNYGQAKVSSKSPQLNEQNFRNALDAVVDGNGNIVCAPGYTNSPIATISSTCAPFNPFGQQNSQAVRDYVTTIAYSQTLNNQYDGVVSLTGPLFSLPGGDFAFALGYEHRAEDSNFDPGAFFYGSGTGDSSQRGSYGRSVPIDPVFGKYHTDEIFGELNADIISPSNDIKGVYELSLEAAGRYIWNSQAGGDPTYTFQGRWAPVADIAFRAAYTRAVRAPSITEAFNPTSTSYGFAVDVCDQTLVNQGPDPATRAANCAAAGVPADFNSLSDQRSFLNYTFGNPNLQNEKSDSFTAGVVLTPTFIPGFNATVDYIDIKIQNAISEFTGDQVVAGCYDAVDYPNNPFCPLITRDANHQISNLGTSYFNSAKLKYRGIVANVQYTRPTPFLGAMSTLGVKLSYQHLISRTNQVTVGSVPDQIDDSVGYSTDKGILTFDYSNGPFNGMLQINYIGPASVDPNKTPDFYTVPRVDSFTFVNLSVSYKVTDYLKLHADVDNLFDAKAPYPYPASGGVSTYFQGIMGTYIRVGAGVNF